MNEMNDEAIQEMNDEAMQEMMESRLKGLKDRPPVDNEDLQAYSLLFEALGKEPAIPLRTAFSSKVTARILARENRAADLKIYALVGFGLMALLSGAYMYLDSLDFLPTSSLAVFLIKNKGALVFSIVTLLVVQVLDKSLIQSYKVLNL